MLAEHDGFPHFTMPMFLLTIVQAFPTAPFLQLFSQLNGLAFTRNRSYHLADRHERDLRVTRERSLILTRHFSAARRVPPICTEFFTRA